MPTIKGTASVVDDHAILKLLRKTKFPKTFQQNVNLNKVNVRVLSQWIEERISAILGFEDDIVQSTAINLFLPENNEPVNPKRAQLDLVGFLGNEEAAKFVKELWEMMIDAQTSPHGIPRNLLEEKKKELTSKAQKERPPEMDKWAQEAMRRAEQARAILSAQQPPPQGVEVKPPAPVSPNRNDDDERKLFVVDRHGDRKHKKSLDSGKKKSRWDQPNSNSISDKKLSRNSSNYTDDDSFTSTSSSSYNGREKKSRKRSKKRRRERSRSRERR